MFSLRSKKIIFKLSSVPTLITLSEDRLLSLNKSTSLGRVRGYVFYGEKETFWDLVIYLLYYCIFVLVLSE